MRRRTQLVSLFVFLLFLALSTMAGAAAPGDGVEALLDMLSAKGVISVEEATALRSKPGTAAAIDLSRVVELLQSKGTITAKEAEDLHLGSAGQTARESVKPVVPAAPADGVLESSVVALPEKEIRPVIEVLREQGVLGTEEAAQLLERIGKKWKAEDDDRIAASDDELEYRRTTLTKEVILSEIALLRQQAVINNDETGRIRERFLRKFSMEQIAGTIDENMRRDVQTQVAEKIIPVPEWTRRIRVGGDFRLRYEGDYFGSGNGIFVSPASPTQLLNSTVDRNMLRIRARLAFSAKVNDELEVGFGLATGTTTNPVSTNATLGDSLNKKNFLLDTAYMKWDPYATLTLWGGRFANPWFGSDLVWDQDINFDGVAFSYKPKFSSTLSMFLTAGAFAIQEVEFSSHDKWLYAGQLGLQYRDDKRLTATVAAAIFDFENTVGEVNTGGIDVSTGKPISLGDKDWTAPQFQQKGNTLVNIDPTGLQSNARMAYAAKFRELNIGTSVNIGFWDPLRVVLMGDYVNNIGYDSAKVNARTGHEVKKETKGYQVGLSVGYPSTREYGQWKLLTNYKYLGADAVMDAFADSDFHLGGTNAKGWILGGDLGVGKNTWLSTRWMTTNEISGPPLAVDVFHLNVNARF
ncbi:MAG: putative porin [Desulfuromonadales bacterium]